MKGELTFLQKGIMEKMKTIIHVMQQNQLLQDFDIIGQKKEDVFEGSVISIDKK